ncbi:hypothetical protein FSP39_010849 [Pinctada imbricata]|uniref:Nudix hydrolase domain-containing protein n=1 Tax=Pinctada imbricata TaxID=66713 RepID=A0AA88XZK1_PINIB|nr:hypothetical protein FSP39_010849 [Pinctada imbricata]
MDPDISVMFSVPCNTTITESNTAVNINSSFNRCPLGELDNEISSIWKVRLTENPRLFNGTKFRLDSVLLTDDSLTMNLGLTCYRDFIGTNWSPKAKEIQELGQNKFNNPQACMSDAMGVGAFVETSDKHVIFLKRSMHCGEATGLWDIPGGHAEPKELVGKIPYEEIDISTMSTTDVVKETYDSIIREVVDEVNLPRSSLSSPILIGAARNLTASGRPSVEFIIRCSLSSSEVISLYNKGNQEEADESTNIRLIPVQEIVSMKIDHEFWRNMAPSAKGCIILYKLHTNT